MELVIYPYIISQRTEYSKIKLFDISQNKYIENNALAEKIIEDYNKQLEYSKNYFEIKNNCLVSVTDNITHDNIEFLFIPKNITSIENYSLSYGNFQYINLPDTLENIGAGTFYRCDKLKYIDIPKSVNTIQKNAFTDCFSLKEVNLPDIKEIAPDLFYNCSSLKNIVIPDTVEFIKSYAFGNVFNLERIKLSKNLKLIGTNAFMKCTNLQKINFPNTLEYIGEEAFNMCNSLKEVIIPDNVKQLAPRAFKGCVSLKYVKLPSKMKVMQEELFKDCITLNDVIIPDSIESLGEQVFRGTNCLKNINVPKNLTTIYKNSPFSYSNVRTLTFTSNLEKLEIKDQDLIGTSLIDKLIIDKSVSTITSNAFKYSGQQITSIDYLGSKEEFNIFKENNKELFDKYLTNVKEINFIQKTLENNIENTR